MFTMIKGTCCSKIHRPWRFIILALIATIVGSIYMSRNSTLPSSMIAVKTSKKKIIIFTSSGGGGHISVSNALTNYLQDKYEIKTAHIFSDVLSSIDPAQFLFAQKYTGEEVYNYFIRKQWTPVLNLMCNFGKWYFSLRKNKTRKLIQRYLRQEKADLVISVIPIVNGMVLKAAQNLDIPFLLIPTDLNTKTFVHGLETPEYDKFHMAFPFDCEEIYQTADRADIDPDNTSILGVPLKPEFFKTKNLTSIRKDFNIPSEKPTVMIMAGAQGSSKTYDIVKTLSHVTQPAHLIVCIGKNKSMRKRLEKLHLPKHISISIIDFTKRIPELMAISDVLITKSGTISVAEGMYMNVPLMLDASSTLLKWEKLNHEIVEEYGLGHSFTSLKQAAQVLDHMLVQPEHLEIIKNNLANFEKKHGGLEAQKIVDKLLKDRPIIT